MFEATIAPLNCMSSLKNTIQNNTLHKIRLQRWPHSLNKNWILSCTYFIYWIVLYSVGVYVMVSTLCTCTLLVRRQLSEPSAPVSPQPSLMRTPGVSATWAAHKSKPQVKRLRMSRCVCTHKSTTAAKISSFEPRACGGIIWADQIHQGSFWHRKPRLL